MAPLGSPFPLILLVFLSLFISLFVPRPSLPPPPSRSHITLLGFTYRLWGLRAGAGPEGGRGTEHRAVLHLPSIRHRALGHELQPRTGRGHQQGQEYGQKTRYPQRRRRRR